MKILFVTPDLPFPQVNGGKIRMYQLIKNVASVHEVVLLSFDRLPDEPGRVEAMEQVCSRVVSVPLEPHQTQRWKRLVQLRSLASSKPYQFYWGHSRSMQRAIDQVCSETAFDLIQVEFSQMGYYDYPENVPLLLDQHNVEYDIFRRVHEQERSLLRRLMSGQDLRKFRNHEIDFCRKVDRCVVTSDRDRELLLADGVDTPIDVVPNGVDTAYFNDAPVDGDLEIDEPGNDGSAANPAMAPIPERTDGPSILFTGTISYFPNTDGLSYFFKEILPLIRRQLPDVCFTVAGRHPPDSIMRHDDKTSVIVTGGVDDIRPYYRAAQVVVVPLRVGGGTRLKIMEALAMGKAVVSTTVGSEGIAAVHGEHLVLADEPEAFASEVVRLLRDPAERDRLARAGAELVGRRYDWSALGADLIDSQVKTIG